MSTKLKRGTQASIEKLNIIGVRSFDHRDVGQAITFKAPLTLIVGYNGSGKTTIIECLKYASTGTLPPNAKSQGTWVHDPKLTGDPEVTAQVKMRFQNALGHKIVVTRFISCLVKKDGNYTQKGIESTVLTEKDGERTTVSGKQLVMDRAIPMYMGVSAAILENVIFCHQEESLWPMSEPGPLKAKFDQIFEAEKYTKAIDSLGAMRKKHAASLAVLVNEGKHSKENNNKAKKVQQKLYDLQASIERKRDQITDLEDNLKEIERVRQEKAKQKMAAESIVNTLKNKRERAENIEYTLRTLRQNLQERTESSAELQSLLDDYEQTMARYTEQNDGLKDQYQEVENSMKATRAQVSEKQREKGQYAAQKENHENNLLNRARLVKESARSHSLREYDGDLDDTMIAEFINRIQTMFTDKDRELTRCKDTTADEVREHRDAVTEIKNSKASRVQEKLTAKQQITTDDKSIRNKQSELDLIRMDEGTKAALDSSYHETDESLKKARSAFEAANWNNKLSTEKAHLTELDDESSRLNQALVERTKAMQDTAALDIAKKEAKQAQSSLDTMVSTHGDQLKAVIGDGWTPVNLQREYRVVLDQHERFVAEAKSKKDNADRDYHEHTFALNSLKSDLAKKTSELGSCESVILGSSPDGKPYESVEEYLTETASLENELEEIKKNLNAASFGSEYYGKALEVMKSKNCCRLCERSLSASEKTPFTEKVNRALKRYIKEDLEAELAETNTYLSKVRKVRPQYESWKRLSERDIPAARKDVQNMESKTQPLISRCEKQDEALNVVESTKREVATLASTVADITKYCTEVSRQEEKIVKYSSQTKLSGITLSLEEIQEQQSTCKERIRVIKAKIDKISADRDTARNEINDLERELGVLQNKLNSAQHLIEKKQVLSDTIKNLQDHKEQQRDIVKRAENELEQLEPDLAKAQAKCDDAQRRGDAKVQILQKDKDKLNQTVNRINLVEDSISKYVASGGLNKLPACERALLALEQDIKRLESERQDITKKSTEVNGFIADSEQNKRSIVDNINYRKSLHDLEAVQAEIQELEPLDSLTEFKRFSKEESDAYNKGLVQKAEKERLFTLALAEDEQLKEGVREWDLDYKNSAQKWREDNIRVQTTRAAVEDLTKCQHALDRAIIQFHTLKMEEVNNIAADLWRSTYQGTDVEKIMIKSENDKATTNKTRRIYNYRVVMVKQGAEMDMRGRCSAGQKVLASIIIRLALAESFGVACGVIALDEPTTNLDSDNIKALAESLNAIIKDRKHQKNFQLIIITHDEDFLKAMKCREFTEEYWRVSRNAEQNSIIKKQDLSLLERE